jgi:hypothetical protein
MPEIPFGWTANNKKLVLKKSEMQVGFSMNIGYKNTFRNKF